MSCSKPDGVLETSTRAPSGPASYLVAHKTPGRTRERTHYELTDALADWVRTPATLPRIQNEPVVRLLAADLVDPAAVLEGLEAMRTDLHDAIAGVEEGEERAAGLTHRAHLLEVNHRYAQRMLALQQEWLEEAEAALSAGSSRSSRSPS